VKVVLLQDVSKLGQAGEIHDVAPGYARNYLIPQGMARKATPGAIEQVRREQAVQTRKQERLEDHYQELAERLQDVTLNFKAKAGEKGQLYGSITPMDIAEALERELNEEIDRRKHLEDVEAIRETGETTITVEFTPEITAEVKVVVEPEEEEESGE